MLQEGVTNRQRYQWRRPATAAVAEDSPPRLATAREVGGGGGGGEGMATGGAVTARVGGKAEEGPQITCRWVH